MTKKTFISTILLFVFAFVVVHNIVPHHHHDEVSDISHHEHNHHDKKEQDNHSENDEPIGLFSHPTHIVTSTEFTFNRNNSSQKTQYVKQFISFTNFITKTFRINVVIKQKPTNYTFVIPIHPYCSTYSLRGPPVLYV